MEKGFNLYLMPIEIKCLPNKTVHICFSFNFFHSFLLLNSKMLFLHELFMQRMKIDKAINIKNVDDFQRYYIGMFPQLKYFTRRYIDDMGVVDDLIQDAWLKLWEQQTVFPNENALKVYLYRAIRNAALNHLRTQMHEQERYQALYKQRMEDEEPTILNEIIEAEIYAMLNEAFSELSESCKRVYMESLRGKSQKEIAESLNISVNTVKKHINNANHYLKKRLDKLFLLLSLLH